MIDQLSVDARKARQRGLSYGKYKALQQEGILPNSKEVKQTPVAADNYRKGVLCKICGKPVPNTRRNYCSGPCADIANRENAKLKWQRHYQKNK